MPASMDQRSHNAPLPASAGRTSQHGGGPPQRASGPQSTLPPLSRARGRVAAVGMASPVAARLTALRRPGSVDYVLVLAVVMLLLLGLVMVYSASQFATPGDPGYWFRHQIIWAMLGGIALLVTSRVEYSLWRHVALPGMVLTLVLLVAVLAAGHTIYGAQRWLHVGFFSFQPSELTKLALALYVADWLARKGDAVRTVRNGLLPFAALTGVVLALILLQNDLGTSIVVAVLAIAMFFAAGANPLQLLPTLALGGLATFVLAAGSSFRRARLDAFLHPLPPGCADAASYQVCQGLISLGSGGLFGRGLGDSVQKAGYLPNPFTDSIFAITGEELGLVGCLFILGLFGLLALRGLRVSRRAPDAFGALLACGLTCWLLTQAAINIGSVVDALPFTGVPLPFVSFGGSSLVTALAAVGVLLNISRHADAHTPAVRQSAL
jgi:cell division protein FtsW